MNPRKYADSATASHDGRHAAASPERTDRPAYQRAHRPTRPAKNTHATAPVRGA